jgi:rubrerythrin
MASNKVIDKDTLKERVRQLLAIDKMAMDVYIDLANNIKDSELKDKFSDIAWEEGRHIALSQEILLLLGG